MINDYANVIGGAERFLDNLVREAGSGVEFFRTNITDLLPTVESSHWFGPFREKRRKYLISWRIVQRLKKQIKHYAPDILHINNNHLCTNSVQYAINQSGIPVFHFVHDYYTIRKLDFPLCLKASAGSTYITHELQMFHQLQARGLKAQLVKVPFDPEKWIPRDLSFSGMPRYDLLYIGRMEKTKGVYELIHAMQIIRKKRPEMTLAMIGDGSEKPRLRQQIQESGLGHQIHLVDTLDDVRLEQYYHGARLVVMPAPRESLGYVGLEAQACGVPVVAFANEGTLRWCRDNDNGFLVRGHTAQNLAERILEIIHDDVLLARISKTARESIFEGAYNATDLRITDLYKAAIS